MHWHVTIATMQKQFWNTIRRKTTIMQDRNRAPPRNVLRSASSRIRTSWKSQPPNQNTQVRNIRTQWNRGTTTIRRSPGATVHLKPHFQPQLTNRTSKATNNHIVIQSPEYRGTAESTHGKPRGNCRNAEGPHATPNRMPADFMPLFMHPNRTTTGRPLIQWACRGRSKRGYRRAAAWQPACGPELRVAQRRWDGSTTVSPGLRTADDGHANASV